MFEHGLHRTIGPWIRKSKVFALIIYTVSATNTSGFCRICCVTVLGVGHLERATDRRKKGGQCSRPRCRIRSARRPRPQKRPRMTPASSNRVRATPSTSNTARAILLRANTPRMPPPTANTPRTPSLTVNTPRAMPMTVNMPTVQLHSHCLPYSRCCRRQPRPRTGSIPWCSNFNLSLSSSRSSPSSKVTIPWYPQLPLPLQRPHVVLYPTLSAKWLVFKTTPGVAAHNAQLKPASRLTPSTPSVVDIFQNPFPLNTGHLIQ